MKKLAQPTRSFIRLKISRKISPGWLHLVFHFGTENRADQLKKPPCIWRKNATDQHCLVACCMGVISGTEKPLQLWLKSFVSFHFMKWILTVDTHLTPMRALSSSLLHLRSQRPATYNLNEIKSFLSTKIIEQHFKRGHRGPQRTTKLNYWYPPIAF